jgi:hypothetical protein
LRKKEKKRKERERERERERDKNKKVNSSHDMQTICETRQTIL